MLTVPLQPIESQAVTCVLGGQYCQINVYQKAYGVFLDLYINDVLIIGGVLCRNGVRTVRSVYLGFIGDLVFIDTQGSSDPQYQGIGSRYVLVYLAPSEI